jgi:hypothetical protein
MKPVYIFKMVNVDTGYVGTEPKIDRIGCFDCIPEVVKKSKSDDSKTEKEVICKLTVPTGYHFKEGFMASLSNPEKPDMKIISVSKYTSHCVCECVSWK